MIDKYRVPFKYVQTLSIIILLLLVFTSCSTLDNAETETERISIFYSPHPDDETLSMGAAILDRTEQDETVHVVLLTRGGASSAFEQVNDRLETEGMAPITIEAFMQARVDEFTEAVSTLGIKETHAHIFDYPDGALEVEDVMDVMNEMEEMYPDAHHHAFSYADPHPDHAVTGIALQELYNQQIVNRASFYYPKYVDIDIGSEVHAPESRTDQLREALNAYGVWQPRQGRYAIGHASVGYAFEQAEEALFDWKHGPGE